MDGKVKKLLITGAFGLVGSNICKFLERDHPNIEVTKVKFDVSETGVYKDEDGDLQQLADEQFDYVIHAAGYGQPQLFSKDKLKTIEINTVVTKRLFDYVKPTGKFLFVSTSEVYSGAPSPHKETDIGTTTPQHHRACYIEGKRCGEAICMAYKEMGYNVKIARLALAYGPGTKKHDTRALNQFIEQALTKKKIKLLDDGSDKRTYIYVEDAAYTMLDILFSGREVVYNVGGTYETTIADLATVIATMTDANLEFGEKKLEGSPNSVKLDMTKTINEFSMTTVDFYSGLMKTIDYQKKLYE